MYRENAPILKRGASALPLHRRGELVYPLTQVKTLQKVPGDGVLTAPADALSTVNSGLSLETRLPERVADDSDDLFLLFLYSGVVNRTGRPKIECADVGAESHSPVVCS